jgi:alpha-glucoside transport system substrate-binding protein
MTGRAHRTRIALITSAVAGSMLLAACSSSSGGSAAATNTDPACAQYSAYQGHSGTTVTMFASIISPESDKFINSWKQFESCTGITITYEGSNDFESQLPVRVTGGTPPDLAFIPQPGLLAQMVKTGKVVKAPDAVAAAVDADWNAAWKTYGSVNGTFYSAPLGSNMKSLVWYSPKAFAAAGYQVPSTWDDLMALSDKIAKAGKGKPWCGGISSGTATGWPSTDWLEEIVMRQAGPDVYDKWISHDVKFNSPEITKAMDTLAGWMKNPAWVNAGFGDVKTIATTTFQDAGKPITTGQCWMLQQASFYANQWPAGTKVASDGDVFAFYLPPMGSTFGKPVEGGGEFVTAFSDRPEVQAVQTYLTDVNWINGKIKLGDWVSANKKADLNGYGNEIDKLSATLLTDPTATFRFDASDLMPAAVGSGAEWKEMTAWFAENKSTQAVLSAIDAAWPS